jgi:hypothetical protein
MDKFAADLAKALKEICDASTHNIDIGLHCRAAVALQRYYNEVEILKLGEGSNTWKEHPEKCPNCKWCSELVETADHGWRCVNCKWDSYHQFKKEQDELAKST